MTLLKRSRIPPFPVYYELFYTYATGANADLNNAMNAILTRSGTLSVAEASQLCEDFLDIADLDERLRAMSDAMSRKITDVNQAIELAMVTANSYSGSLQQASGDIEAGIDEEALQLLSVRLLKETRRMQDMNRKLEAQLENSKDDISLLQRDLDEVRKESMLDPLTKIPNRKCFDEHLNAELERVRDGSGTLCLLMIDIDHFKAFNDNYGHLTGDHVLRLVAQVLKANLKGRDLPARFGGEEFVAILPDTELTGAATVAESIRRTVQGKELLKRSTNEKLGRITLSIGVAEYKPGEPAASFIERADRSLYAAKKNGRNTVISEAELPNKPDAGVA